MKNLQDNENQSFVTYYRVQGGKLPLASYKSVSLNENGELELSQEFLLNKKLPKSVFFGDTEFMQSFLMKRATGFLLSSITEGWNLEVVKNIIPRFVDDFISKNAHSEIKGVSLRNPVRVSHGPGIGYQFNSDWRNLFFAFSIQTGIVEIKSKTEMRKFLFNTALNRDFQTTRKIDGEVVLSCLKNIISCKMGGNVKLRKNEEPGLIGLSTFLDQMEKNSSLFSTPKSKLTKEISNVRRDYNNLCEKTKR